MPTDLMHFMAESMSSQPSVRHPRRVRLLPVCVCAILCAAFVAAGCAAPPKPYISPFAAADEPEAADLLDDPTPRADRARAARVKPAAQQRLMLPLPPAETRKAIDGEVSDWDKRKVKKFSGKRYLASGEQFWDGDRDASFQVAIDSDPGHLYFWVEVQDDRVIDAESKDIMSDGVIIWLQDPALKDLIDSLPPEMAKKRRIQPEIAILFTPDGQFWRYDPHGEGLYREGISAATQKTERGYRLEVALTLGVLEQVAALPLKKIAFRVELMDGDEPSRRGEQTRMSMLPDEAGPRFALYDMGEWLPYVEAWGQPVNEGTLGRWVLKDNVWRYDSFEVVPAFWTVLEERAAFLKTLDQAPIFDEICPLATTERHLVEAYQSTRGTHRAGLLVCGPRAPHGRCPADATTELYWVHLTRSGDTWALAKYARMLDKPLEQCAMVARPGGALYSSFSLLPLEMLGGSVWGVGWSLEHNTPQERVNEKGIWFSNPALDRAYMGEAVSQRYRSEPRERIMATSRVFLVDVDDVEGLDICEVEHYRLQDCAGLNNRCTTREHGESVRVHVKLWEPQKQRFETYMQTKHRGCSAASFEFSSRRGFMLLNEQGRLGAVASPANYADEADATDTRTLDLGVDLGGGGGASSGGNTQDDDGAADGTDLW